MALEGNLSGPEGARGVVLFAHGTGALNEVARLAREWFERHLITAEAHATGVSTPEA